jgi:glycosyltransferase involved in cell wall biosynthesis
VKQAIQYFRRQDYPNKELLILDDGPEFSAEDVPRDPRIRYLRIEGTRSLGSKRNLACELASGEIIAHWDDDDWSAPNRLSSQVRALLETASIGLCGLRRIYFFEPHRLRAWLYEHPAGGRPWVAGGTMCYRKEFWQQLRFPDVTEGEDTRFVWSDRGSRVLQLDDPSIYAATVHSLNTSPKRTSDSRWRSWPIDAIRELLSEDWQFYKDWAERGTEAAVRGAGASVS